ncbi:MAG: NifU family protein [Phycisphaerales bacterium]
MPASINPANAPSPTSAGNPPLKDRVAQILELIRPAVQADGGDLELVDVTAAGVVQIRLHGACVGCPSSQVTLQTGIERNLRQHIPEVKAVQAVA